MNEYHYELPLDGETIRNIPTGRVIYLNGTLYTARDQAHKRIVAAINAGEPLPFPLKTAAIYYCGPTPARKNEVIGSCGPTTSGRMDAYTPLLIEHGLRVMIGKGERSEAVCAAIKAHNAIYLTAIGGAAALYKNAVKSCEVIAYPELGCEAVYKLCVEDFPVVRL